MGLAVACVLSASCNGCCYTWVSRDVVFQTVGMRVCAQVATSVNTTNRNDSNTINANRITIDHHSNNNSS